MEIVLIPKKPTKSERKFEDIQCRIRAKQIEIEKATGAQRIKLGNECRELEKQLVTEIMQPTPENEKEVYKSFDFNIGRLTFSLDLTRQTQLSFAIDIGELTPGFNVWLFRIVLAIYWSNEDNFRMTLPGERYDID